MLAQKARRATCLFTHVFTRLGLALCIGATAAPACAQNGDAAVLEAREALRKKDSARLAGLRATTGNERHALAQWVEHWELGNRLNEARVDEVEAFYTRWRGTYVEDRLRNDWLLELGHRRDWAAFARDFPRFRMNDDREVTCYWLLTEHLAGKPVRDAARAAWLAQRDADEGCQQMAEALFEAKVFDADMVFEKLHSSAEQGRARAARAAAGLLGAPVAAAVAEAFDQPARQLSRNPAGMAARASGQAQAPQTQRPATKPALKRPPRHSPPPSPAGAEAWTAPAATSAALAARTASEIVAIAVARMAANDPLPAAEQLRERWQGVLPGELAAWAWSQVARHSAQKLQAEAAGLYRDAWRQTSQQPKSAPWSDETLGWAVRAALRGNDRERFVQVRRAIDAMSASEQREPAWQYWQARALRQEAGDNAEGELQRGEARRMFQALAGQLHFYGKLSAEALGQPLALPPPPAPLTAAERDAARAQPGFARALQLIGIGLRNEGVREWNFTLRGMGDRELLAAAQLACEREVWDRCINTSERTRGEIDIQQRFPLPYRNEVVAKAREIGLDPAYVYGLIRQESRFVMDARSSVGASGLMQLMPATARWTARKIGLDYRGEMITDREVNLKLGTAYLKLVLDDFEGSQALAAAAYNAGPSRPRRWREGPALEPAVWAENIPFAETRDYVKKVLSNAVYYAALLGGGAPQPLKARLGSSIGPRSASAPVANTELP